VIGSVSHSLATPEIVTRLTNNQDFTTFDVMSDMSFGEPFGCVRDGVWHVRASLITQTIKAGAYK
jgi:hypothetical protein